MFIRTAPPSACSWLASHAMPWLYGLLPPDPEHPARPIPAASASTGTAINLLTFIVLPSPGAKSRISLYVSVALRIVHPVQSRTTGKQLGWGPTWQVIARLSRGRLSTSNSAQPVELGICRSGARVRRPSRR